MPRETRISVAAIVNAVRAEPFVPSDPVDATIAVLHPDGRVAHFVPSLAWQAAWNELSPVEGSAAEVVFGWLARPLAARGLRHLARVLRRRSLRRSLTKLPPDDRAAIERLRASVRVQVGATRPIDPLTPLCGLLHAAGLPASAIVPLLDTLAIERAPRSGGRERVQRRIDRWRAWARRHSGPTLAPFHRGFGR